MYHVIENPKMMSGEDIDKKFDGKWVYVVKADITKHGEMLMGLPVVVADSPFEGRENGIYERYDSKEYAKRCAHNLKHYEPCIPSVFSVEFVQ
jgi:hypothetical protein